MWPVAFIHPTQQSAVPIHFHRSTRSVYPTSVIPSNQIVVLLFLMSGWWGTGDGTGGYGAVLIIDYLRYANGAGSTVNYGEGLSLARPLKIRRWTMWSMDFLKIFWQRGGGCSTVQAFIGPRAPLLLACYTDHRWTTRYLWNKQSRKKYPLTHQSFFDCLGYPVCIAFMGSLPLLFTSIFLSINVLRGHDPCYFLLISRD